MSKVVIHKDGVKRTVTTRSWLKMKKEKATYGWQEVHEIPIDIAAKEAEILKSKAKGDEDKVSQDKAANTDTSKKEEVAVKEIKVRKSKAKGDEE